MEPKMSEWSTCALCGRVVYITHLNQHGNCSDHPEPVNGSDLGTPVELLQEFVLEDEKLPPPLHLKTGDKGMAK